MNTATLTKWERFKQRLEREKQALDEFVAGLCFLLAGCGGLYLLFKGLRWVLH